MDKQDDLSAVIDGHVRMLIAMPPPGPISSSGAELDKPAVEWSERIAAAVRAYMESPEVVERVARALFARQFGSGTLSLADVPELNRSHWFSTARAALSAATRIDEGGSRG